MDRAYEDDQTRQLALELDYIPVVPPKTNRLESWEYDRAMYKKHNVIERLFRRLKRIRRIFSKFDKSKLDIPFVKLGRRCLYDRVDLDIWIEEYKLCEHGRAKKEAIWSKPKKVSTGGKIPASDGLQQSSQTAKEYAKALGLKTGKMPWCGISQ